MKMYVLSILLCILFILSSFSSAFTVQNQAKNYTNEIPINGEISGTIDSTNVWVGTIDVQGTYFKIEIDHHTNYRSYLIDSILTAPSGEKHGTHGITEPYNLPDYYSGPIDPRYYYFETPETGIWTLELTKSSNIGDVDFTITTSIRLYPERPGHRETIERNFYFPGLLLINYVDYAQPDGFVYEINDVKDLDIRIGTTEVVQPLKGYGAITLAIPKGKAVLKEDLIESKFSSILFNPWTYDQITDIVEFVEFVDIITGVFVNTFLGIFKTIAEAFFDVIDYLNNDRSYDHGTGPESSIWQDDENYDFYSFSYNTGDPNGGVATARQEFKFPIELKDYDQVDIQTHVTYTLTGAMGYTETVGYEETVTFHKNTHYPPEIPTVTGPDEGYVGSPAGPFTACTTDPNQNDGIYYGWDWDNDDEVDEWSEVYSNGDCDSRSHTWNSAGEYTFKVKARDGCNDFGDFSIPFTITISEPVPEICNPTPSNGATNQDTELNCQWDCNNGESVLFNFYLGESETTLIKQNSEKFQQKHYQLSSLEKGKVYYWKVVAYRNGEEFDGPIWSFSTQADDLTVDAGGPYEGKPNEFITFEATANGGIEPYTYVWDFDNDGEYEKEGRAVVHSWPSSGSYYYVEVKVTDSAGNTATDNCDVNIERCRVKLNLNQILLRFFKDLFDFVIISLAI